MAARARRAARMGLLEGKDVWKLLRLPLPVPVREGPTVPSWVSLRVLVAVLLFPKRFDFRTSSLFSCVQAP